MIVGERVFLILPSGQLIIVPLPETNSKLAPENQWLTVGSDECPFCGPAYFQG